MENFNVKKTGKWRFGIYFERKLEGERACFDKRT